jgi:integrase
MVNYYAKAKLSKIWSEDEISQILNAVDKTHGIGKRDYAMLVITANLGLRSSDVLKLSINNFDWKNGTINIVQDKTGEPLILPLSEQVGKAVIDYWQNGRPITVADELFVQHTLPYMGLSSAMAYRIFNKYFLSCDIVIPPGKKHGLHSLRHSLASRLLEKDTPVNVVGNILGHVNSETAKNYIRIDISKLKECGLEVPEIG